MNGGARNSVQIMDAFIGYGGQRGQGGYWVGCTKFESLAGEVTFVLGHNGTGKTTLLRGIAGSAIVQGDGLLRGGGVSYDIGKAGERLTWVDVSCASFLSDHLLVRDHLAFRFALLNGRKCGFADAERSRAEWAVRLDALGYRDVLDWLEFPVRSLSKGQRQLLGLSLALVDLREIILADEVTAGLDLANSERALSRIVRQTGRGSTAVVVTHDIELAARYGSRFYVVSSAGRDFVNAAGERRRVDAMVDELTTLPALGSSTARASVPGYEERLRTALSRAARLPGGN